MLSWDSGASTVEKTELSGQLVASARDGHCAVEIREGAGFPGESGS